MAKRGRPRKRGGLVRSLATPKVPVSVACEGNEVVLSLELSIELQPGSVEKTDEHPGNSQTQIGGEGLIPVELWGDEEGELVENQVTMTSLRGSPYLSALQRDSEDAELQLNPLAGNRDLNKGIPLSHKSTRGCAEAMLRLNAALAEVHRDVPGRSKLHSPIAQDMGVRTSAGQVR
ncbi:hypothetical protein Dimus_008964 [Dionaea muscipula]